MGEPAVQIQAGADIVTTDEIKESAGAIRESRWRCENLLLTLGWGHADDQPEDHTQGDTTD